ncbi:unnamed protein product [Mytilus coruscus]|uniref:Ig-like domain-containing protein n=1 Tax=Mytilus coruscus TaxID=42192 RepID=A0A6J8EB14_MYTCO|nr:unnamed protein product [Mytilus coruscus]
MNLIKCVVTLCLIIIREIHDAYSITVRINQNISGLIDESGAQIKCSFTRHNVTKIFAIELKADNETVVTFLPDDKPRFTTKGQYLEGRVTLMNISKVSTEAVLTFDNLTCIDQINYSCSIVYLDQNSKTERRNSGFTSLFVKVPPSKPNIVTMVYSFEDDTTTPITTENTTSPHFTARQNRFKTTISQMISNRRTTNDEHSNVTSTILKKGDNITFICTGNVGNPPGKFIWQKYKHGENPTDYTDITTTIQEVSDMCSYNGSSTLTIQVTDEDNQAIIRCTVISPLAQPNMYIETIPMEVQSPDLDTTMETRRTTSGTTIGNTVTVSTDQPKLHSASGYIDICVGVGIAVLLLLIIEFVYTNEREKRKKVDIMSLKKNLIPANSYEQIPLSNDTGKETVDIDDIKKQNMVYIETQEKDDKNKFSTFRRNSPTQHAVYAQVNEAGKTQYSNNTQTQTISIQKGKQSQDEQKDINDQSTERINKQNLSDKAQNVNKETIDSYHSLKTHENFIRYRSIRSILRAYRFFIHFWIICKLQVVYPIAVQITTIAFEVVEESDTQLKCSYTKGNAIMIFAVELKTDDETIATFVPGDIPRLTTIGYYLTERVTLMNITEDSSEAVMIFDKLSCFNERNYSCSVIYLDVNSKTEIINSGFVSFVVKVPPSKPDNIASAKLWDDLTTVLMTGSTKINVK